jgi:hypothetical protein
MLQMSYWTEAVDTPIDPIRDLYGETSMKNAAIRGIRTYLQVFVGLLLAGWTDFADSEQFLDLATSAAVAAVPALLAFIQNALEDNTTVNVPKG